MNFKVKLFLMLPAILLFLTGAKVYKWTDENGQVHFGTQPPPAKMQEVKATRYGKSGAEKADPADIIQNKWYAKSNGKVIAFTPGDYGYQWSTYTGPTKPQYSPGKWELFPNKLTLTEKSGIEKHFALKNVHKYDMTLVEHESEEQFHFKRLRSARYDLSEQEEAVAGQWAEVNPRDGTTVIARINFEDGQFTRYYVDRHNRMIHSKANPNYVNAVGNWQIEEDVLILDYAAGFKNLWNKSTETERWKIEQLDFRNLLLTQENTRSKMHFKRKREK